MRLPIDARSRPLQVTPDVVVRSACLLGESPTWDAPRQRLLWLDIEARVLHQLDAAGRHVTLGLDRRATAVVVDERGELVVAADCAVSRLDSSTGQVAAPLAGLPPDGDGETNDGRCDPWGRLWVGTVDRSGAGAAGLFCVAADGAVVKVRAGVGLSNGMDWSPDGRTCHYVDSLTHRVESMHLDDDGLPVSSATLTEVEHVPDGVAVDADGGVWVALWDGAAVQRYTPGGRLDRVVTVPGGFVTSCAFGGSDLSTLYITTAQGGFPGAPRRRELHAGDLFAVDVGVQGRGYTPFGTRQTWRARPSPDDPWSRQVDPNPPRRSST